MVNWINKIKEYFIERKKKKLYESCGDSINKYDNFLHKNQKKRDIKDFDDCLEHQSLLIIEILNLFDSKIVGHLMRRSILYQSGKLNTNFLSFAYGQSMQPEINEGDIIMSGFPKHIEKGDIISSIYGCHRVIEILEKEIDGEKRIFYKTKGDNNKEEDPYVPDLLVSCKIIKIIKRDSDLYKIFYDFLTKHD